MQSIDIITKEDIDLIDKLDNMSGSEISERVYNLSNEQNNFKEIEEKIWEMLGDSNLPYYNAEYFEVLAPEYDAVDEHDKLTAGLYNCDLIYMQAIAFVLKLEIPNSSSDYLA